MNEILDTVNQLTWPGAFAIAAVVAGAAWVLGKIFSD